MEPSSLPVIKNSHSGETHMHEISEVASRRIESVAMSYGSYARIVLSSAAE